MENDLPKDLAGWQNVRSGHVRVGDRIICGNLDDIVTYECASRGIAVGDDGTANWLGTPLRVYRRIETPKHRLPEEPGMFEGNPVIVAAPDPKATLRAERGRVYGDPLLSHENIGLSWTGLIQQHYGIKLDHPLPSWLVALMMVAFKCQRAARVYHADNFRDGSVYLDFAEEGQKIDPEAQVQ